MATKRAYVYKDGLDYKVSPAVVILKKTDRFQLVNTTGDDATWTVPVEIFDTPIKKEPLTKNSKSGEKKPKPSLTKPVGVGYEVKFGLARAKGNSDPVIIIDP